MRYVYLILIALVSFALVSCTGLSAEENQELMRLAEHLRIVQQAIDEQGLNPALAAELAAATTRIAELTAKGQEAGGSIDWETIGLFLGSIAVSIFGAERVVTAKRGGIHARKGEAPTAA